MLRCGFTSEIVFLLKTLLQSAVTVSIKIKALWKDMKFIVE
jgi:hypothetical protein